ncbi:MAG: GNAT family N-acetyltransferase [Pseudomonadota bacterium]
MSYLNLTQDNIDTEHICCAFSDKKCAESYQRKKDWLRLQFDHDYVFRRLDARAKVFIEHGPAEMAWVPVTAPNYIMLGCFWVSGKYKRKGHGKALLADTIKAAKAAGKTGLVAVAGTKKFHFMSDGKWLVRQGFETCETLTTGFQLLALRFDSKAPLPAFNESARKGVSAERKGVVAYYSNRCPYSEFHVQTSLKETCRARGLPLTVIKLTTCEAAQAAPTPATIFSLFLDGQFITTNISVCMDSRFEKIVGIE